MPEPTVVVYDPITKLCWNYNVEREAPAAYGIELVLPADQASARAALPRAGVVVASGDLPSEDLDLMTRCCAIVRYSIV